MAQSDGSRRRSAQSLEAPPRSWLLVISLCQAVCKSAPQVKARGVTIELYRVTDQPRS